MHFDERQSHRGDGVPQRNTRVRERAGIENQEVRRFAARLVDPPDQLVLGVALEGRQLMAGLVRPPRARFDALEGVGAVDLRLPGAQEVQVRAVDQEYSRHRAWTVALSKAREFTLSRRRLGTFGGKFA